MTPPTCGGHYYDPGGPDDNHGVANNPPHTIICPDEAWQIASLTFEQVELANAVTLQIFDGLPPVSNASLLQTLFGNNIPTAPINSTSPDGCLTAFFSQGSFEPPPPLAGWKATMECFDCRPVHSFEQVVGFSDSLYAKWDALEKAVGYDWEIGLRGFTPNAGEELLSGSIGAVNELMVGGLPSNTYLELYLTANCDTLGISSATPNLFYTAPKCGDIFYDSGLSSDIYGNNESFITTICPDEPDQVLTLDFGFVNTQTCCDMIRIYRLFPSQALAWLATLNGSLSAKSISSGVPGECLVFEFESNDETAGLGWECAVNCAGPNSTDFAPAAQSSLALFPNPAEETVMLLFESPATSTAKVSLYAPTGQVVQQKELDLKAGANEQSLDIEHFAPGVYFVVVESETEVSVERLVVN
jgi:hypothetical protein